MSGRREKIVVTPGTAPKDAELVEISEAEEPWSTYRLADGTVVKTKMVTAEAWRVENEYDGEGTPVYVLKATAVTNVSSPDRLKRPKH